MKLDELNLTADSQRIESLMGEINSVAATNGREVSDSEFRNMVLRERPEH